MIFDGKSADEYRLCMDSRYRCSSDAEMSTLPIRQSYERAG
ncbi:hypothetical protein TREVI0001_1264 [Treponema vincentii ATCC 35580]|uniref:Uncharacterized protein n=1 Tax=Treponema vincentii ATCC 35580 TaxID=596324 RepID=C8PS98_9SPIR|nr:hypothetical protein TREVI0001_1264 [Treponema vincentii ATCC 35580]